MSIDNFRARTLGVAVRFVKGPFRDALGDANSSGLILINVIGMLLFAMICGIVSAGDIFLGTTDAFKVRMFAPSGCIWVSAVIGAITLRAARRATGKALKAVIWLLPLCAGLAIIWLPIHLIGKANERGELPANAFGGTTDAQRAEFSVAFKESLTYAHGLVKNVANLQTDSEVSPKRPLVYPLRSLVVILPREVTYRQPTRSECGYHFACPKRWLASGKGDVKLLVLVFPVKHAKFGYYEGSGRPAIRTTWSVVFIDMSREQIVALKHLSVQDQDPGFLDPGHGSEKDPAPYRVVSTIEKTVTFSERQSQIGSLTR